MRKIAVVGSREFPSKEFVMDKLKEHLFGVDCIVISGGAKGVDSWAKEFCDKYDIPIIEIRPILPFSYINYKYRDVEILTYADEIIAFWNETSKGTKFVIDYSNQRNKKVTLYTMISGESQNEYEL